MHHPARGERRAGPVADACDVADFCDGASAACPDARLPDGDGDGVCDVAGPLPRSSPTRQQADGDDDGLGDACDPCTGGVAIGKPKIKVTNYLTAPGDDSFSFNGALDFANAPLLDPLGARRARRPRGRRRRCAVRRRRSRPGAYNPATRTGWLANGASTAFTFRTTQPVGGVIDKLKLSRTTARPDLVKFDDVGQARRRSRRAAPVQPLTAIVVLDAPTAATGECGEVAFARARADRRRAASTAAAARSAASERRPRGERSDRGPAPRGRRAVRVCAVQVRRAAALPLRSASRSSCPSGTVERLRGLARLLLALARARVLAHALVVATRALAVDLVAGCSSRCLVGSVFMQSPRALRRAGPRPEPHARPGSSARRSPPRGDRTRCRRCR